MRKQNWEIGKDVRVGFLTYKVVDKVGNDFRLEDCNGNKYSFIPFRGIIKL